VQILDTAFWGSPLWGLKDNVRCSSWAHWKARSGLPISVNWTFSLGVTAEALRANIGSKSAISLRRGPVGPKFQVEGVAPANHSSYQKTRLNGQIFIPFCHSTHVWQTDGRTDRILIDRPRLHFMQSGKNEATFR